MSTTAITKPTVNISTEALTPEEQQQFRRVYDKIADEYFEGRTPSTREKLKYTRYLRQQWQHGWTVVGKTYQHITLGTDQQPTAAQILAQGKASTPVRDLVLVGACIAFAALILWYVTSAKSSPVADQPADSPTVLPMVASGPPLPTMAPPTIGSGSITVGKSAPTVLNPTSINLGDRSFVVTPSGLDTNQNWVVTADPLYANWLAGSLVNLTFFLGLETDPASAVFTQRIQTAPYPTARITINSNSGIITTRTFQIDTVRPIARTETDVYNSTQLGVTILIRPDSSDQRLYLHGHELLAADAAKEVIPDPTP